MFSQKTENVIERQARHVSFLSQFTHDIEHVSGKTNVLSRLELATLGKAFLTSISGLQYIISGGKVTSLILEARQTANGTVYFNTAHKRTRLLIPQCHWRAVFVSLHVQAHGGRAAINRIIKARFVWHGMDREIRPWVRVYENCQRA